MAASATNTSREMGAVFGVAILGAIVNAKLTGDLAARLKAIGIPPSFQCLVMHAIQTGGASAAARRRSRALEERGRRPIATKVVNAAYDAFGSGLHVALVLSGSLLIAGGILVILVPMGSPTERSTRGRSKLADRPGRITGQVGSSRSLRQSADADQAS